MTRKIGCIIFIAMLATVLIPADYLMAQTPDNTLWQEAPFDRPFDELMVQSHVEGLTALSHLASSSWPRGNVEGLSPPCSAVC